SSQEATGDRAPIFVVGISWGGKLAAALEAQHSGLTDGLALLCPGFCPRVRPSFLDRVRIGLAGVTETSRAYPIPLSDPELFTATPEWQDFIRNDTLGLRKATARLLVQSVRLDYELRRAARRIVVPIVVMLAGRDKIIDNIRTRRFVGRFASSDKEIIEYAE